MGVKDLWNILTPLGERKPLFELQGKAVAVDLSCWVVDSQTVTDNAAQPKLYLRNLYFRTAFMLLHEIFPVFVLEGKAPSLKHKTIAKRNMIRSDSMGEKKTKRNAGRSRFNHVLAECEEMLKYMGLTCVQGYGEAEAMCAYLNEDGLVEGCISQDSDCFLYGAKIVYRNYCTKGSVDEYSLKKSEQAFNLGRNKMIALALLCGCDYNEGINGIGKEAALKLFKLVDDDEILERLESWRTDPKFDKMEEELKNPNICTSCGHPGKIRTHTKSGCIDCGTSKKCKEDYKETRSLISNEVAMRKKALLVEDFPSKELIDEFLLRKGPVPSLLDLQWKQPQILNFVHFMDRRGLWEPEYAFAKIFPLMTRWQLKNLIDIPAERQLAMSGLFLPDKIRKIRNIQSVASYEILWLDRDHTHEDLISNVNKENADEEPSDILTELMTIEPQDYVLNCYPNLVEEFENARNAKKKKPAKPRKKPITKDLNTEQPKRPERKRAKVSKNQKIDKFIKLNHPESLEESFEKLTLSAKRSRKSTDLSELKPLATCTPKKSSPQCTQKNILKELNSIPKKRGPQFDRVMTTEKMDTILNGSLEVMFNELTPEDFASDAEYSDMSIIIDEICGIRRENNFAPEEENKDKDVTKDEFDVFEETYVPLHQRLNTLMNRRSSTFDDKRFSIGIDSLLNGTDD